MGQSLLKLWPIFTYADYCRWPDDEMIFPCAAGSARIDNLWIRWTGFVFCFQRLW